MSFYQGATNVTVKGGTQIAVGVGGTISISQGQAGGNKGFKDLSAAAAHTALHDSAARFGAPRCHRSTRAKHLDRLKRWMLGDEEHGARLIWLHGGAGAGKSAIMQSIVERCTPYAVILGSFFFSRSDPSRNYAEVLVPTLAYQLACAFPETMAILEPVIQRNPLVFKASLHKQAYELLIRPLLYLIETGIIENPGPHCRTFVIDGLDECSDPQKQVLIIDILASILCDYDVPVNFLIASRPEVAISSALQRERKLHNNLTSICLDGDVDAESDIHQFIVDSFLDIAETHPLRHHIILPWPDSRSIATLVWKSSGHFVFAATAMKFIASSDEHPTRALQVVQGLKPSRTRSPFAELDALYLHILTSAKYSSQVLGILRHCYLTGFYKTVAAVCCIFYISPADVELFLSDVRSLVYLSPDDNAEITIIPRHASLEDFLADERRSVGIYMDADTYHASLVAQYFRLVDMGPSAVTPLIKGTSIRGLELNFISALATAITSSRNVDLLHTLINSHSPRHIWAFCVESFAPHATILTGPSHVRWTTIRSVLLYLDAIRESTANADNKLFSRQLQEYIELLLDNLNQLVHRKPQYRIVSPLIFSSAPSELGLVDHLMRYCGRQLRIGGSYRYHFRYLQGNLSGVVDPQLLDAFLHLPQRRLSWSADLAIAMELILEQLLDSSRTPVHLCPNRRRKPWVPRSELLKPMCSAYSTLRAHKIHTRRRQCHFLLKAVILFLPKSDCTSQVATLARKLLPKAALWFPRLMKRARTEMDSYVLNWEGSLDGFMEKAKLLSINDID